MITLRHGHWWASSFNYAYRTKLIIGLIKKTWAWSKDISLFLSMFNASVQQYHILWYSGLPLSNFCGHLCWVLCDSAMCGSLALMSWSFTIFCIAFLLPVELKPSLAGPVQCLLLPSSQTGKNITYSSVSCGPFSHMDCCCSIPFTVVHVLPSCPGGCLSDISGRCPTYHWCNMIVLTGCHHCSVWLLHSGYPNQFDGLVGKWVENTSPQVYSHSKRKRHSGTEEFLGTSSCACLFKFITSAIILVVYWCIFLQTKHDWCMIPKTWHYLWGSWSSCHVILHEWPLL